MQALTCRPRTRRTAWKKQNRESRMVRRPNPCGCVRPRGHAPVIDPANTRLHEGGWGHPQNTSSNLTSVCWEAYLHVRSFDPSREVSGHQISMDQLDRLDGGISTSLSFPPVPRVARPFVARRRGQEKGSPVRRTPQRAGEGLARSSHAAEGRRRARPFVARRRGQEKGSLF
jgi:hypothetical protein